MDSILDTWDGLQAVRLTGGGYEALILPAFGANCIKLRHIASGADLFRTPPGAAALRSDPNVYGLPLLFPPNRIRDGFYIFQGRRYAFPINEPSRHHHIHGFLSSSLFRWEGGGDFTYRADKSHPYLSFPHGFTMKRSYALDERGLNQTLSVSNDSELDMPLGVGFHASWNVPLIPGEKAEDYALCIPADRQWLTDPRSIIPTGEILADSPVLCRLREGTLHPEGQALSCLMAWGAGPIRLTGPRGALVCRQDGAFPFVMLWNGGGGKGFVCPEPQTWLTDAPNLPFPRAETGFAALAPGEKREYRLSYAFQGA